jgi:hypothetical protein
LWVVRKGALQSTRARTVGVKMSGLEARLSSLEAAEREANAAEKAVREAEERMMRLSKVSASPSRPMPEPAPLPAPTTATVYSAAAMDDKEKGDDDDDDEPKEKKEPNDPFADGFGPYLNHSLDELFNPWKSPMNWLLLCTPFAYYGHHYGWDDVTVFILSVLAIAPMAERVSFVTEQLAMHTSETIGGLLNATFGNVTELIVSLVALFGGMLRIVQVSLLGSILSNLLLVLGCAFLVGGLKYPEQKYSHKAQTLSFSLLLLAVLCIAMPTVLEITHDVEYPEHSSLDVSRSMSLMMIVTYYLYLVFRTRMHADCVSDCLPHEDRDLLPLPRLPKAPTTRAPIECSQAVNARRAVNAHWPRCHRRAAAAAPALLRRSAAWCPVLGCLGPLGPPTWPSQSPTRPSHSALPLGPPNLPLGPPTRPSHSVLPIGPPYWPSLLVFPIREPL